MVFAPTGRSPDDFAEPVPATAPQRGRRIVAPATTSDTGLPWRAVVHVGDADTVRTEWHLAGCQSPAESSAHCPEGQRLMETEGQPDGHCVLDGHCGRCEAQRDPRAA